MFCSLALRLHILIAITHNLRMPVHHEVFQSICNCSAALSLVHFGGPADMSSVFSGKACRSEDGLRSDTC